ncbi:response regulator [Paenibacillus favisporus]|uniref:response regulator n=1 Tax=Paenibacillus favisporus TaxID=221028 RepID=UPI003D2B5752
MEGSGRHYTAILVDDEPIILRSLKAAIPWEELGIEVAGEAKNGEGALDLVREHAPDIIISDIRMPGMDGITLMKEVLTENPGRIFIVISGYGEFEYAREALRQGAFDYLLKPIDHDELTEMLKRAAARLDARRADDRLLHSVQVLSVMARERMYAEWIEGNDRPRGPLAWLESHELDEDYFMAVVQLDHYHQLSERWSMAEKRLWLFAVRNILEEWSQQYGCLAVFPFHSGEWIVLFPDALQPRKITLGHDLIDRIRTYSKLKCSVGLSRTTQGIHQLSRAYDGAARALYQRFYSEQEGVFADTEHEDMAGHPDLKYPKHLESQLLDAIRTLDTGRLNACWDELKGYLEEQAYPKEGTERLLIELTIVLCRQLEQGNPPMDWRLDGLIHELHDQGSLHDAIALLKEAFAVQMTDHLKSQHREDGPTVVEKAKQYISNHYHQDLSIEEVAEVADLSISHFCTLFKQVSGYTFLEYLTECRMDKAKYMLSHTSVKVYQIAPLVGYQDPKYFTQVFKKATGQTPTEYRESHAAISGKN